MVNACLRRLTKAAGETTFADNNVLRTFLEIDYTGIHRHPTLNTIGRTFPHKQSAEPSAMNNKTLETLYVLLSPSGEHTINYIR